MVGDPYATVDGKAEAGTITVLFGEDDQRIGEGDRLTLDQSDFGETPEAGDHFGWAVALNRTTAAGATASSSAPRARTSTDSTAPEWPTSTRSIRPARVPQPEPSAVNLDQSDLGGTVEAEDELGYSVAALGGNDEYEVKFAFGAPGENNDAGVVNTTESLGFGDGVQDRQGSARGSRVIPGRRSVRRGDGLLILVGAGRRRGVVPSTSELPGT